MAHGVKVKLQAVAFLLTTVACSDPAAPRETLPLQFQGQVLLGGNVSVPVPAHLEPTGVNCQLRSSPDGVDLTPHEHKPLDGQFCGLFGSSGNYSATMTLAEVGKYYLIVVF